MFMKKSSLRSLLPFLRRVGQGCSRGWPYWYWAKRNDPCLKIGFNGSGRIGPAKMFSSILTLLLLSNLIHPMMGVAKEPSQSLDPIGAQLDRLDRRVSGVLSRVERLETKEAQAPSTSSTTEPLDEKYGELAERLDVQEDIIQELDEKVGSRAVVHAFDAVELDLGGFLHSTFTHIHGDNGSATSFDRLTFEILMKAQFSKRFSAFFAQAFVRESNTRFTDTFQRTSPGFTFSGSGGVKTPLVIAWANYQHHDAFNIQIGRYITPFGIINIEHFPAILLDTEQPQFLRPFSGDTIFPNFITGAQVHGQMYFSENIFQYNVYTGVFTGSTAENFYSGARGAFTLSSLGTTFGLNAGTGKRSIVTTTPDTMMPTSNATFYMYGVDVLIDKGPVLWKNELFFTNEGSGSGGNRTGYYTQPAYRMTDQWVVFYRYDFLNDGSLQIAPASGGPRLHTPGNSTEHAFGVNFLPVPNVRLRAVATVKNFSSGRLGAPDADAQIFQLSGTFSF